MFTAQTVSATLKIKKHLGLMDASLKTDVLQDAIPQESTDLLYCTGRTMKVLMKSIVILMGHLMRSSPDLHVRFGRSRQVEFSHSSLAPHITLIPNALKLQIRGFRVRGEVCARSGRAWQRSKRVGLSQGLSLERAHYVSPASFEMQILRSK